MTLHYKGRVGKLLSSLGISDYDRIRVFKDGEVYEGILIPRPEILDDEHLIIKLDNGYNIGINIKGARIELISKVSPSKEKKMPELRYRGDLPFIPLIVTGGTITSKVDTPQAPL